jgi:integrase
MRARGNITQRGRRSWRIKFDVGYGEDGRRICHCETVIGSRADAAALLRKRITEHDEGQLVRQTSMTLLAYACHWLENIAPATAAGKTRERYAELIEGHIGPHIGGIALQKLDGTVIDAFYAKLARAGRLDGKGGLSPQTVRHIHRLLSQILGSAVKAQKIRSTPMQAVQATPKVPRARIELLAQEELTALLWHLEGKPLYVPVLVAAATGLRRGELLALRWSDIDLDNAMLRVEQSVELVAGTMSLKAPKTERSRRTIALPDNVVAELKTYRKQYAEHCLAIGHGRVDLLFPDWRTGGLQNPEAISKAFAAEVKAAGITPVTLHSLRHSHITHLLRSGAPVHVVSARAGHSRPTQTLNTYAHLLSGDDRRAAAIMDAALAPGIRRR